MGEIYYINIRKKNANSAGSKAPADIAVLCGRRGFKELPFAPFPAERGGLYRKLWLMTAAWRQWLHVFRVLKPGDTVLFQHPIYGTRLSLVWVRRAKRKGVRFIGLIHDLESLRGGIDGVTVHHRKTGEIGDGRLLGLFDAVICHNERMREYLIRCGIKEERLISLGLFDYLTETEGGLRTKSERPTLAIAGNLACGKCGYIYELAGLSGNRELDINLYGKNFDASRASGRLSWKGTYEPEELPAKLEGDFGLVWDGPRADTCAGNTGAYLRWNNPHKTSLYLAAGLPVIIWREAALAPFILERGAGLAVDSLEGLGELIRGLSDEEYRRLCIHAAKAGAEVRAGVYFNRAVDRALELAAAQEQ